MAKGSFADQFKAIMSGVSRTIESSADEIARDYANEAAEIIRARTRAGSGVAKDGGSASRLKPLSPRYIEWRRRNARLLSAQTAAGKSNLTLTGSLLDELAAVRKRKGTWVVKPMGRRNERVAEYVSRDRPFLFLSRTEQEKLARDSQRKFDALARRKGLR